MFHVKEGLYFERQGDTIKIIKKENAKDEAKIVFETDLTLDSFGSLIVYLMEKDN